MSMNAGDARRLPGGEWLVDWFSPHEFTAHSVAETLFREDSPYQQIEIVRTRDYGKCLVLNGEVQSYEADEFIYHETLVHPALLLHPDPRRVLIIGGGEGATLREVLRHTTVEEAVMVDLDARVVEAARAHLESFHQGAFEDPRTRLTFGDGRAFVEKTDELFDAILVDINNPLDGGPSWKLFTLEFYEALRGRLAPGGVVAAQSGAITPLSFTCPATVRATLGAAIPSACLAMVYIPSYAAGWTFVVAGDRLTPPLELSPEEVDRRLEERCSARLNFYDGLSHQRLFSLPRYVRDGLARVWPLSRDAAPIVEKFPGYTPPG